MLQLYKMNSSIRVIVNIALIIALYYFTYYTYLGITNPVPAPGDSWDYHIPISESIINGTFLFLPHVTVPQRFYPGSSEAINSILILLHIPLTISNIIAMLVLFVSLYKLGRCFKLQQYLALLYAVTFITLNAVVRWQNAISIDIWVAVFFTLAIILLENPKKSINYFGKLGFVFGMLIGSKYTSFFFLVVFLILYGKILIKYCSLQKIIAFIIPFSIFGLFWYVRNYFLKGNPFFPIPFLGFKGTLIFNDTVWNQTLHNPINLLNAAFSEYHLWILSIFAAFYIITKQLIKHRNLRLQGETKLFLIGIINFIIFFTFPTDSQPWIMVSSFRYSYPTFIPLILGVFILASNYKKEEWLGYFAVANMLSILSMTYYPKLILFYLPISFLLIYLINKTLQLKKYNKN
jgi:hypothetical protein